MGWRSGIGKGFSVGVRVGGWGVPPRRRRARARVNRRDVSPSIPATSLAARSTSSLTTTWSASLPAQPLLVVADLEPAPHAGLVVAPGAQPLPPGPPRSAPR